MTQLAKSAPDVLLCISDVATRAALKLTPAVRIVGLSSDMVGGGLVRSLARPGGNITGISILGTELNGKRLEILVEAVPGARSIAVLAESVMTQPAELQALQNAARARCRGRGLYSRGARTDRANDGQSQGMGGHCT